MDSNRATGLEALIFLIIVGAGLAYFAPRQSLNVLQSVVLWLQYNLIQRF